VRRYTWLLLVVAILFAATQLPRPGRQPARAQEGLASDDETLLAQLVCGEARGEPYEGKVAVAAVILNRVNDDRFPNSVAGVVYETHAFEAVENGEIYRGVEEECAQAARVALNGYDPVDGAVFFFAPAKTDHPFMVARPQVRTIGGHAFAR
jgi:N-acetylmuramoyl-L-alanine amidase